MTAQRDEAWLKAATPDEIIAAHDAGELAELLGRPVPVAVEGQADEAWLKTAAPERIVTAYEAGQLDELLGRTAG